MTAELGDLVAVVSGGASGIGAHTARLMIERGARVIVTDVAPKLGLALVSELGDGAAFIEHEVSAEASWRAVMEMAPQRHGRVDVLVNNAGISQPGTAESTSAAEFHRMVAVNQLGCFLGIQAAIAPMRAAGGGSIVNTASVVALRSTPGLFAYTATKWAVRGMSLTAAMELATDRIRVNAVFPGPIDTPLTRPLLTDEREQFFHACRSHGKARRARLPR